MLFLEGKNLRHATYTEILKLDRFHVMMLYDMISYDFRRCNTIQDCTTRATAYHVLVQIKVLYVGVHDVYMSTWIQYASSARSIVCVNSVTLHHARSHMYYSMHHSHVYSYHARNDIPVTLVRCMTYTYDVQRTSITGFFI